MSENLFSTHDIEALETMLEIANDHHGTVKLMSVLAMSFSIEIHGAYPDLLTQVKATSYSLSQLVKELTEILDEVKNADHGS